MCSVIGKVYLKNFGGTCLLGTKSEQTKDNIKEWDAAGRLHFIFFLGKNVFIKITLKSPYCQVTDLRKAN